jgi:hypothetical protein
MRHQASTPVPAQAEEARFFRVEFPRPFAKTSTGSARVIVVKKPSTQDVAERFLRVAQLSPRQFPTFVMDNLTDNVELACAEVDDGEGHRRVHPLSEPLWGALAATNGADAPLRVIAAFAALL